MTSKQVLNKLRDIATYLNDYQATQVNAACDELEKIFNLKITKTLEAFYFLNENFKISVYHTRHNDTGYEMSITDNDNNTVYCEDVSEEVYLMFKELKND